MNDLAEHSQLLQIEPIDQLSFQNARRLIDEHVELIIAGLFLNQEENYIHSLVLELFSIVLQFSKFMQDLPSSQTLPQLFVEFKSKYQMLVTTVKQIRYHSESRIPKRLLPSIERFHDSLALSITPRG
jgi:hypothetical protein